MWVTGAASYLLEVQLYEIVYNSLSTMLWEYMYAIGIIAE